MKSIILVRHGKSSWEYSVSDKDRPLKERGINDAKLVAQQFNKENIAIDQAYSSLANRALHTAVIVLRTIGHSFQDFEISEELYDFSGGSVENFVQNLDDQYDTVMIFGHNHAFTSLVNRWGNQYIDNVPTSGLVYIEFSENTWKSISKGITKSIIFPKHLK